MAERKVRSLLKAGASVTVVSPTLTPKLLALRGSGHINHIGRHYEDGDLKGAFLTISATGASGLNDKIVADGSLVNAADAPQMCDFIVPSSVTRGQLSIAVSTAGISPALSRTIADELHGMFGREFSSYLTFLKVFRNKVIASVKDKQARAALLKMAGDGTSVTAVRDGRLDELKSELTGRLQMFQDDD
ncbi:MAG: bifunctional precorrin-2 dehydrogenase/sirohydrochlorin ferrochelatase [Candidatus Magnetominusculus sp. LBB02]|nr:bifunctional precorrin-2 dehydrogenase/sirohydrochlorin ferrochelatase [Candidatus Magnetominusculus sp. LBB02]